MKVMFYTMGMSKGGCERNITNIANELISKYDITIVTNNNMDSAYKLDKKIKHIKIDTKKRRIYNKISYHRTKELKKIINIEKPNLIIAMLPEASIRVLSLKKKINIPIIVAIRNHPEYEFKGLKLLRNYYYQKADLILTQSPVYFKYLPFKKMDYIPNYIDNSFIDFKKKVKKKNIIVTVSRLAYQKNISLLIKAFAKLPFPSYQLHIYGIGQDEQKLRKLIHKLHLEKRVILKGNSNDIASDISHAKLFVLTSRYEGMPNALIEALYLGIPAISTNSSEVISDIIDDGKNGFIVSNKNDLINKMIYLLENSERLNEFSKNTILIRDKFNREDIIDKWYTVIDNYTKK